MKRHFSGRIGAAPARWVVVLTMIAFWSTTSHHPSEESGATTPRTAVASWSCSAFAPPAARSTPRAFRQHPSWRSLSIFSSKRQHLVSMRVSSVNKAPTDDVVEAVDNDGEGDEEEAKKRQRRQERWDRIVKAGQDRAIANKKKREPTLDKKRRVLMFYKEKQREKKKMSKVPRLVQFKDRNATLADLVVGSTVNGTVISLTPFGAYVDIGTECDGLLHVSQLSRETFVEHPRQVLEPGQQVQVRIRAVSPALKKLQLTMLDSEFVDDPNDGNNDDKDEGIPLEDVAVDDELWGELSRVTDYGAYVEVGARVSGFLHFMDHPGFTWPENKGAHPRAYMKVGDRVRVWVSNVDLDRQRIKLTAYRPKHLPGPRREIAY